MKTRTALVLAGVGFLAMSTGIVIGVVVEWSFASSSRMGALDAIHNFHGVCNVGVGQPYQKFIHQLRVMAESGDTNRLVTVLHRADERSRDIYDVWLGVNAGGDMGGDAYEKSIDEILK